MRCEVELEDEEPAVPGSIVISACVMGVIVFFVDDWEGDVDEKDNGSAEDCCYALKGVERFEVL